MESTSVYAKKCALACVVAVTAVGVGIYSYLHDVRVGVMSSLMGVFCAWMVVREAKRIRDGRQNGPTQMKAGPILTAWVVFLGTVMLLSLCLLGYLLLVT
jgi:hypothetical protein